MFRFVRKRLRNRPDSEHEMTFNRMALNLLALIYFAVDDAYGWSTSGKIQLVDEYFTFSHATVIAGLYLIVSLGLLGHILWKPGVSPVRRIIAMVADMGFVTYVMHIGGERFLWCYPFLLWAIFGNGFRFGAKYLFMASGVATAAFAIMMIYNPFWQRYPALSWGCLLGLIILPAYVSVLIRKLSEAIDAAESANRAKSLFLASISHELRTPLNAIIGLSGLMSATRLNPEQTDMTQTIGDAGRSLLSLINSVLDLSRLEVGKMPLIEEKIDLYNLLNRVRNITSVIAQKKGVRVCLQISSDAPQFIMASARQIDEVITNLASNAVKFTEQGYVMICLRVSNVTGNNVTLIFDVKDTGIGIAEEAQASIFERFMQADETIIDRFGGTGLGLAIAKQMAEQRGGTISVKSEPGKGSTFTAVMTFEQVEGMLAPAIAAQKVVLLSQDQQLIETILDSVASVIVAKRPSDAIEIINQSHNRGEDRPILVYDLDCPGDPLAIARMLEVASGSTESSRTIAINRHSSEVIDDELGQHFASVIQGEITKSSLERAIRIASPALSKLNPDGNPIDIFHAETSGHILVADDNKTNQKVIGKILERAGHKVTIADDGKIALELLQSNAFDLALMDINMPELNGFQATKLYKLSCMGQKSVPIFALTADVTEETRLKAIDAGMHDCLGKPIEPQQLLAVIDEQIKAAGGSVSVFSEPAAANDSDTRENVENAEGDAGPVHNPIDTLALGDLANLGGKDFVKEIVDQFIDDSVEILKGLAKAVETQNYHAFRDALHALRSGAANVGARDVFQYCLKWREIDPQELAAYGDDHLHTLHAELDQARVLLTDHVRQHADNRQTDPQILRRA